VPVRAAEESRWPDPPGPVTTRALTRDDLSLLHRWLNTPHVRSWWRGEPTTPSDIARKYEPRIDGVVPTRVFIIDLCGEAVGMIQCYRHTDHPDWDRAVGIAAAAGIDYLLGEASQCGRGIGPAAIASFTPRVFASYPDIDVIVAAPQADNYPSRRALEKAGFTLLEERQLDSDDPSDAGPCAIYTLARSCCEAGRRTHQ
jgi:RimJ/RimL family protein N-acetyltransferase